MSDYLSKSARKRPREDFEEYGGGRKRGRYSAPGGMIRPPETPKQHLESLISRLGEKSQKSLESNLEALCTVLVGEMATFSDHILATITKCVVSSKEKVLVYSSLVGLLNARKFEVGELILDLVMAELKKTLTLAQYDTTRHLVIFLADLINWKVVTVNSIVALFDTFVTVTFEPDIPQVHSDLYVHMVLAALPSVGAELEDKKRQELERLLVTIDNYMSKRSTLYLPMFQVWSSDQSHPQEDTLSVLWAGIKALRGGDWKCDMLLNLHTEFTTELSGAHIHTLSSVQIPPYSADFAHPLPTVVFRLFSSGDVRFGNEDSVLPPPSSIDRYLATERVTAILSSHHTNRKECASALLAFSESCRERGKIAGDYIIVETVFGHIMTLPRPPQVLIYYSSVLIEMCKSRLAVYPQLLSQTTDLLFSRLDTMNSVAINRFALWFSHHLSNFKYQWDWTKWNHVAESSKDHPTVRFLSEVFSRCIRLACYEDFIELIPPDLVSLLPPEPSPVFKYRDHNDSAEGEVAAKLLEAIKNKESLENLRSILEGLTVVGGAHTSVYDSRMEILTHCVLRVGCKTITHCFLALVKFRPLFMELSDEGNCKNTCLKAVAHFYSKNTQLHGLVIDKLLRMGVVDGISVVNWLCGDTSLFTRVFPWNVLTSTLNKAKSSLSAAKKELKQTQERLSKVSALDEVASGGDERAGIEAHTEELAETVEERERALKDLLLILFERLVEVLRSPGHSALWGDCVLDHCRQLLAENQPELSKLAALLEDRVFVTGVHPRLLEAFTQFQALL